MDPTDFNNMLASYGGGISSPQATAVQPQPTQQSAPTNIPQSKGNFLTRLLPTIGGIGGGVLGAVFGGGVGGVGGAAAGSAGGKALENELEGNSLESGVAANAAEGAVGEGTGSLLGRVGGKLLGVAGGKAEGIADNLVKGQVAKGTITQDGANALRQLGATDSRQWQPIADAVTGDSGALNQGVKQGLSESTTPADLSGLSSKAQDLVSENQMQLNAASIPQVNKAIQGALIKAVNPEDVTQLAGKAGSVTNTFTPGSLSNVLPEKAFNVAKNFEGLASSAYNSATDKMGNVVNADQLAKFKVFSGLADHAKQVAFGGDNPIPLTDEVKSNIISNLDPLKDINPTVHANLVSQVSNAQTLQDLRGLQAPFVQGSKAVDATAKMADRGPGTTASTVVGNLPTAGAMAAGPHGMLAGLLASTVRSPAADRAAVPLLEHGGNILSNIGGSKLPGILGGAAGVGVGTSNNLIQPSNQNSATISSMQPPTAQDPTTGTPGGLSRDDLITLALYSPGAFNSLVGASADQQGKVSAANSAETALTSLGNAPGGGILSGITGKLGLGGTGEYQRKATSAAEQVAGALPGTDEKAIEKQLTDYAAGGGNIDDAIKSLLQRLSSVVNSNSNPAYQQLINQPNNVLSQVPLSASAVQ